MDVRPSRQLRFPPFRLDPDNACLWRGTKAVRLTPKAFTVLQCLAERHGQLVTKDFLLESATDDVKLTTKSGEVEGAALRTLAKNALRYSNVMGAIEKKADGRIVFPLPEGDAALRFEAVRLGRAAIFAAPARYEPFGLGILEAAASGCALALGDIPSLRENWEGAALFVAPDDRAAWRSALRHLIEDDGDRALWAFSAQQRARGFSREAMAVGYAALYREMVVGPAQREVA